MRRNRILKLEIRKKCCLYKANKPIFFFKFFFVVFIVFLSLWPMWGLFEFGLGFIVITLKESLLLFLKDNLYFFDSQELMKLLKKELLQWRNIRYRWWHHPWSPINLQVCMGIYTKTLIGHYVMATSNL